MHDPYRMKLVLFSNTYPYGMGETFLADEVPYLAEAFTSITVYPLYKPEGEQRTTPPKVTVESPLLPFDHKDKGGFLRYGLLNTAPFFFAAKEFFRALFGTGIKLGAHPNATHKKAGLGKRLHIFFNYFLMLRTILGDRKKMNLIARECAFADKVYFYWGDKSAMLIPFLKKKLKKLTDNPPLFCVRFHGSDLYEGAKGYLPFRDKIFSAVDYAIPVSYDGMNYIKSNYSPGPRIMEVWHLGSAHHDENFHNFIAEENRDVPQKTDGTFNIVGCANVIPLKRIGLVVSALQMITKDAEACFKIRERGFDKIVYTHFGGGNLLGEIKKEAQNSNAGNRIDLSFDFRGARPHEEVLKHYRENGADLFILASRSEGIPVSIMEAMSYGIPVIATNVGGVKELFRNCPVGYIVDADITAEDIKNQIVEHILLPDSIRNQMKSNCYINWKEEWDAKTNYTRFAEELIGV